MKARADSSSTKVALIAAAIAMVMVVIPASRTADAQAQPDLWVPTGAFVGAEDEYVGLSADASADGLTIVFGGTYFEEDIEDGYARIYRSNGRTWSQLGDDIFPPGAGPQPFTNYEKFARALAISADGNSVIVGAERANGGGVGSSAGTARVFGFDGNNWVQRGSDINGLNPFERAGASVDISADGLTVIVGSPSTTGKTGRARVYSYNGADWVQIGGDLAGNATEQAGSSVAMSSDGTAVVVGAPTGPGLARVYSFDGSDWTQRGADIDGENPSERAGHAVDMSADGNTVAVSAPFNDGGAPNAGHTRVFAFDGATWQQLGADIDGTAISSQSGQHVSLSDDGQTIAVSAFKATPVKTYQLAGGDWAEFGTDLPKGPTALAMSGDGKTLVIGDNGFVTTHKLSDRYLCMGVPVTINMLTGDAGIGTSGNDVILGTNGSDTIDGKAGDDRICGGSGSDTITGGPGKDRIWGELGDDAIEAGTGDDRVWAGRGYDTIRGGQGDDRIWGEGGGDLVYGGAGSDQIRGGIGDDELYGRAGDDELNGGPGNDVCIGGPDTNTTTNCEQFTPN